VKEWEYGNFTMHRFECDCLEPEHALDICVERHDTAEVSVSVAMLIGRDLPWKDRLRMVRDIVLNRRVILAETVIKIQDEKAFVEAIKPLLDGHEV
jgi:hypothetical protein